MAVGEQAQVPAAGAEPAAGPVAGAARRPSLEVAMEAALIVLSAVLFGYMLVESFRIHPDVARLPRIAAGFGFVMLVVYVARRAMTWGKVGAAGAIMDTGFDEAGLARREIVTRTLRVVLTTLALFAGIRVFGFHLTIPVYVFGYLVTWGRVPWYWALVAAAGFEAYMVLAYDVATRSFWPDPLIRIGNIPG